MELPLSKIKYGMPNGQVRAQISFEEDHNPIYRHYFFRTILNKTWKNELVGIEAYRTYLTSFEMREMT